MWLHWCCVHVLGEVSGHYTYLEHIDDSLFWAVHLNAPPLPLIMTVWVTLHTHWVACTFSILYCEKSNYLDELTKAKFPWTHCGYQHWCSRSFLNLQVAECWEILFPSSYQVWKHSQLKSQILPEVLLQQLPARLYFYSRVTQISEWPEGLRVNSLQKTEDWCWSLWLHQFSKCLTCAY